MADADPGSWKEIARHDVVMATIRELTERAGAVHVAVLLDRGPDREPPLLECEPGQPLTISRGRGERSSSRRRRSRASSRWRSRSPKPVPASALSVDPALGEVERRRSAPSRRWRAGVRRLARALGRPQRRDGGLRDALGSVAFDRCAAQGNRWSWPIGDHEFQLPETGPSSGRPPNRVKPDPG